MTYYNANPYRDKITAVAHDDCLPVDQFRTVTMSDGYVHTQQIEPWHWSPIFGRPDPCNYCGTPVA